jgi:hypothetical protein
MAVEPKSSQRSKVPSPRLDSAHDASTIACPCAARRSGPPGSDGASATPIGTKRELISAAAPSAAPISPPPATIAIAVNCAEPAKTIADITTTAICDIPAFCATTPNEIASSAAAIANGTPARRPARSRAEG